MVKITNIFRKLKNFGLNLLFPEQLKCIFCGSELSINDEKCTCDNCRSILPFNNNKVCKKCGVKLEGKADYCNFCKGSQLYYKKARAPFLFDGLVENLIYKFKYDGAKYLAKPLSSYMCDEIVLNNFPVDFIIPVPLSKKKKRERGFNQSQLLANEIASRFGSQTINDCLIRIKHTKSQTYLNYNERSKNLENAFKVLNPENIKGKNILLVDDVFTTSATVENCSLELIKSNAKSVYVITLAHRELKNDKKDT